MSNDLDFLKEEMNDLDGLAEGDPFKPIPRGWYHAQIVEAEIQDSKNTVGCKFVYLRLNVLSPGHDGRVIFDRIVVLHPKETPASIGRARFARLCLACGFNQLPDEGTRALVGKVVDVKVKVVPPANGYEASNEVTEYRRHEGGLEVASAMQDDDIPF